ncbi:DNA-binding response regulator [Paenibacillus sp. CCS19]|uniref:response regulator n=1 Tax=Paenibacillus sp. CCS19 TaxID=3158387 RepID=UPI002561391F|nr:response regulator [Paenibacillus cellulosilyticus]GMK37623.1 DNA-binding response regulator [Paenibacillus cellulosilyticus]
MLSLLIVDDESSVVDTLALTIDWEQIDIETVYRAYSANEALRLLSTHSIDIMLADIYMPGMSGIELVEQVHMHHKHVKSVLLSGHAEFQYAKQAMTYKVFDYLLKPASDEEIIEVIGRLAEQVKQDWQDVISHDKVVNTLKESLPVLKDKLLNELLVKRQPQDSLDYLLSLYEVPFQIGDSMHMMLIRLEESFAEYNDRDIYLLEYAIMNIAQEIFAASFELWSCRDANNYLVIAARGRKSPSGEGVVEEAQRFESLALQVQRNIGLYLKRVVSVLVSKRGLFPNDVHALYTHLVNQVRSRLGNETGCFIPGDIPDVELELQPVTLLYETPTFHHLLDSHQWEAFALKLEQVLDNLKQQTNLSEEHVQEAYMVITGAFYHYAHKHNRLLSELLGGMQLVDRSVRSVAHLSEWAYHVLDKFKMNAIVEQRSSKDKLIGKVKDFIARNIGTISLQTIADAVFLHPVYLSRLYKAETGQSISDYIHAQRMEKAAHLLKEDSIRIYEISENLGFKNAAYFSKVFREEFGMSPQEYRDQIKG